MLNFGVVPTCMTDFPIINFSVICPILAPGVDRRIGWSPKGNGHVVLVAWLMATIKGHKQG